MKVTIDVTGKKKDERQDNEKQSVIYPVVKNEKEASVSEGKPAAVIDSILFLSTILVAWILHPISKKIFGNFLLHIVGWGNLGYLVFSTISNLFSRSLESEDDSVLEAEDIEDIVAIITLLLHLFTFVFLVVNRFVVNGTINKLSNAIVCNPLGIYFASSNFLEAQKALKFQKPYHISYIILKAIFIIGAAVSFDYDKDINRGILMRFFLLFFLGIILFIVEDYVISMFKISKEKITSFRVFVNIILVVAYTVAGYYMMNRIFLQESVCSNFPNKV
ncbi:hypothetical protein J0A71_09g18960 [Encephalitozoon cuniculi]|nr:hypothetical protein J0A71_09g18960 [Encephalitozoon cuniculi]